MEKLKAKKELKRTSMKGAFLLLPLIAFNWKEKSFGLGWLIWGAVWYYGEVDQKRGR